MKQKLTTPPTFLLLLTGALIASNLLTNKSWAGDEPVGTYRQRTDQEWRKKNHPGWGSTYIKDNNVWVYTSEFQKRFGMPEEWVDNGLTGAEAIVWRLEPVGRRRCQGEGESRKCVPSYECVLESYISSDETDLSFEHTMAFKPWKDSVAVLAMNHPEIKQQYNLAFGGPSGDLLIGNHENSEKMSLDAMHYHTKMRKNLIQIGSLADCRVRLTNPKTKRLVEYYNSNVKTANHQIDIPSSFWLRVNTYHDSQPEINQRNWFGGIEEDNNIWVYTTEFATRYNLSASNINKELKGAEAVAFRVEPNGYQKCGYFGSRKNCTKRRDESFDFYFTKKIKMAYQTNEIMDGSGPGRIFASSVFFIREQDKSMQIYNPFSNYKSDSYRPVYSRYLGYVNYAYKTRKGVLKQQLSGWEGHSGVFVDSFIRPGVWLNNLGLATLHEGLIKKDKEHNHFLFTDIIKNAPSSPWSFVNALHRVVIPNAFMDLAVRYKEQYNKNNDSSWQVVKGHYGGKN